MLKIQQNQRDLSIYYGITLYYTLYCIYLTRPRTRTRAHARISHFAFVICNSVILSPLPEPCHPAALPPRRRRKCRLHGWTVNSPSGGLSTVQQFDCQIYLKTGMAVESPQSALVAVFTVGHIKVSTAHRSTFCLFSIHGLIHGLSTGYPHGYTVVIHSFSTVLSTGEPSHPSCG